MKNNYALFIPLITAVLLPLAELYAAVSIDRNAGAQAGLAAPASFDATGTWKHSSLPGHHPYAATIYANEANATAVWRPNLESASPARVSFYIVAHASNSRSACVEIAGGGELLATNLDLTAGLPRWETVGVFQFKGKGEEKITLRNTGTGALRLSAVKLDILDPGDTNMVWQTLIFEDTMPMSERNALIPESSFREQKQVVQSGPPAGTGNWMLTFCDEFDGERLDTNVWKVANGAGGKLLGGRWPENCVVEKGLFRLVTKKENRGGKEWSSAMAGTRSFRQKYGYWEARYRYAAAPGLNNAFWTNPGKGGGFEIDFNEGHWPNTINMSLHQGGMSSVSKAWRAVCDLSADFHTYGTLWGEKEIIYYLDGQEIDRKPNTKAHLESPVIFSTAVFTWAGPVTDALDGKSMDVDWVRVWCSVVSQP